MCGSKCLSMLLVVLAVSIDRQTVAAVPVPNIIDGPRAHSIADIPVAIEGKAKDLLDEEGLKGTFDLAMHITDEDDFATVNAHFHLAQESHTPKKKNRRHRRRKNQRN